MEDVRSVPGILETRAMHSDLPEEDDDKYWLRITASNGKRDEHNSIMDPKTTLKNFEEDAKSTLGVALTDHHAYRSFGYGRSANARLTQDNQLLIDFFIVKGMEYEGGRREFRTSQLLIRGIEQGLINQVSVEFFKAREICNLCNLPIRRYSYWWDWEPEREGQCTHKMGKQYKDKNGKMLAATYTVYDARLKAVSLVEYGSNRETSIDTKREVAEALQWVFKEKPGPALAAAFGDGFRNYMEEHMTDQEWTTKLRDALGVASIRSDDEPDAVVEKLETEVTTLRQQVEDEKDKVADLQADAEDGKAYRESRVEEAIKQGNRAHGEAFDEAYHREYYADLPMDKLNEAIASNKKIGDSKLSAGRSTTDTHEPPSEREKVSLRDRKRRGRRR